jgi:hypothetical protein
MSGFLSGLFGRDDPPRPAAPPPPPDAGTRQEDVPPPGAPGRTGGPSRADGSPAGLRRVLDDVVARVNAGGGSMPEGGVPAVHEVEDALRPLLDYLEQNPPTEAELIPVRAVVTDYLPTTVDRYLTLPRDFAATHRALDGRTPAQELLEQLALLRDATQEHATAIYAGDARELSDQGRFLQTKFARSDLTL